MCGRFTMINWEEMIERFGFSAEDLKPRYNIAPTQNVPVIIYEDKPSLKHFRWGLIPFWSKDKSVGNRLINARAETLHEKNSFRHSLQHKRCLVPADGFYEWNKKGAVKIPYRYSLLIGKSFSFAGLWDVWKSAEEGISLYTFTIITTAANSLVSETHDRMPVILPKEAESVWLNPQITDSESLRKLLLPYPSEEMTVSLVNPLVNSPTNDSPQILIT